MLVDGPSPRVLDLSILNVGQRVAKLCEQRLGLLHRGYRQILTHVTDPLDGADNTRCATAKHLQQL